MNKCSIEYLLEDIKDPAKRATSREGTWGRGKGNVDFTEHSVVTFNFFFAMNMQHELF